MTGDKYLLDTNIVLYILNGDEDLVTFLNNQQLHISVITEMELLSFPNISNQESEDISDFIKDLEIIPLNEHVKNIAISTRKIHKLKLPDSIVAASAIANNIQMITADRQFNKINDLQLIFYDNVK
jgi:predicted nucleic acid-binding protein